MPLKDRNTVTAIVGCLLFIIATCWVYTVYIYSPVKRDITQYSTEIQDLQRRYEVAKDRSRQLARMQQEMASLQVDVAHLEKQLPKDRELPALIRVLTHRAESYGLVLGNLTPGRAVSKGLYDEIPYNVSVTTSFHNLGHFLTALGKGDRLFAARNLALTPIGAGTDPSKTINATFQLIAFKYHG